MGELTASIAHELNNPLAIVSLRVEGLLADTPTDDPRRRALEVIEQEVERMARLVANLLQLSRRSEPQISTLDAGEAIERTLELMLYHLRNRDVAVVHELPAALPAVHADRQQVRQLLLNLFTNAADAMPRGGTLTVRAAAGTAVGRPGYVVAEVIDTGQGIAPEHLARVREPFFTTKPEGKGTGLGLALCQRIVQEHRGALEIESEPGRGTTVRVLLPIGNGSTRARD